MKLSNLWHLASAEMRTCIRLVRTWVFIAIGLIICVINWLALTFTHASSSVVLPAAGIYSPRYLTTSFGSILVLMAMLGMIFLAFDIRTRDVRSRMGEVIDCRPFSNIELLSGRLLGIVLLMAIPTAAVVLFFYFYGLIAEASNSSFGSAMESASVFAFLVWDIIPNLLLWGSLTVLAAILLRFRLLVVVVMLTLIVSYFYLSVQMPFFLSMAVVTYTGQAVLPSELVPEFVNAHILINRSLVLLLSAGFLALAAALHSRHISGGVRPRLWVAGATTTLIAIVGVYGLVMVALSDRQQIATWASIHKVYETHTATDVHKASGVVNISPGRRVDLDLVLTMGTENMPSDGAWLFSLNPGYRITELSVNGTAVVDFEFENGLLRVPHHNTEETDVEIAVAASGVPNSSFAYLDSPIDWSALDAFAGQQLYFLGQQNYIFHNQFVALMPGVSWFPMSGAAVGRTAIEERPTDFFELDIEVVVPNDWIVAGPGTRELVSRERKTTFRFNPKNPVPEFALVGSKFERRAMDVEGIQFELLISRQHEESLDTLEVVLPHLRAWIEERVAILQSIGLEYPYGTLSFVEVPLSLRVYGGGWRADTVYAPPGIHMVRESGMPIARFDNALARLEEKIESDEERGEYLYKYLSEFFRNDLHGGNPLINVPRNFVTYQTMPHGHAATAIGFVVDELATALATEGDGYFSTHTILARPRDASIESAIGTPTNDGFTRDLDWRERFADRPSVWNHVVVTALGEIDYLDDAESAYNMLLLKGKAIARSLIDGYSEETVGAFLRELVARYRGKTYRDVDLAAVGLDVGLDFEGLLGDWLNDSSLPGFMVAQPRLERLSDSEQGESIYQASFLLHNGEPVPGVVAFSYETNSDSKKDWEVLRLDPVRIDGNSTTRVALQSGAPVRRVWIEPYLSLNRVPILVSFPELEDFNPTDAPQLPYIVQSEWVSPYPEAIIVDDLDDGFSIKTPDSYVSTPPIPDWMKPFVPFGEPELDEGLQSGAAYAWEPWVREQEPTSYGRYRHTFAFKSRGETTVNAKFSTTLPKSGQWHLNYHLCCLVSSNKESTTGWKFDGEWRRWGRKVGSYSIEVLHDDDAREVEFDLSAASMGWNEIGVFDIVDPKVDVVVSVERRARGIADAVMWTPVESIN